MSDFSGSFTLKKMRSGNPLIYLLKEQFEDFASSPMKVPTCQSIARCFYQLEEYEDAAAWYEVAGKLILAEPAVPSPVRAIAALPEYEKAMDCYKKNSDDEKFTEISTLVNDLRRECASA